LILIIRHVESRSAKAALIDRTAKAVLFYLDNVSLVKREPLKSRLGE
jgi:hypothetical protein